jgi:hypothetical protein
MSIVWQSRLSVPGVADRESEAIIEPLGGGLVRVVQEQAALDLAARRSSRPQRNTRCAEPDLELAMGSE